jgi:methyl-accepting chemotaxis protein
MGFIHKMELSAKILFISLFSSVSTALLLIIVSAIKGNSNIGILVGAAFFMIAASAFGAMFYIKSLKTGGAYLKDVLTRIAEGNYSEKINPEKLSYLGEAATLLDETINSLTSKFTSINEDSQTINMCVESLDENAHKMADEAKSQSASFNEKIASSSKDALSNINSLLGASKVLSESVNSIASSIKEMNNTIDEIAQNCSKESTISNKAVTFIQESTNRVNKLELVVHEIDTITETITDISGQTNLLALNATIEASRAGEAGKGFAVVANEVKELSKQTAQATQDIEKKIDDMRYRTNETIKAFKEISAVIDEINEISQTIVAAVEEQSATIREISNNVNEVNTTSKGISDNIEHIAGTFNEVSDNVAVLSKSFEKNGDYIEFLTSSVDMLKDISTGLENSTKL